MKAIKDKWVRIGQTFSIAGFTLSVLTMTISFVPFVGIIAAIPGFLAFVLSLTAVLMARKGNAPVGLSSVALALSSLGLLIALIWGMIFFQATKKREVPPLEKNEDTKVVRSSPFIHHGVTTGNLYFNYRM